MGKAYRLLLAPAILTLLVGVAMFGVARSLFGL